MGEPTSRSRRPREFNFISSSSVDVNLRRAQQEFVVCNFIRTAFIPYVWHWYGVYGWIDIKVDVSYGKSFKTIHIANALFDTGAGINFIHSAFLAPEWTNICRKERQVKLWTVTKELLQIEGHLTLRIPLEDLYTRFWFGIAPKLAVNLLLGIDFIDRVVCGNFHHKER